MVGDDAQSIYSFRGANIGNILNLQHTYPSLRVFKLERNYRSTQTIINAAGSLIAHNRDQIPKNVYSKNDVGQRIEVMKCYSDYEEGYKVAARLARLHRESGDSYDDFAILYRTNAQSRVLEESLRKRNIPYRIYGGLSFYQRKEVKDAIAYFRLSLNPDDDEALRRIINFPTRGIGDTTLGRLNRAAIDSGTSLWQVILEPSKYEADLKGAALKKLSEFAMMIQGFIALNQEGKDAYQVAKTIIERTGLLAMLLSDKTPETISKRENLMELLNGVQIFVDTALEEGTDRTSLSDFLAEVSLATDQDSDTEGGHNDRVTMMTVHAAKGLEFNNIFVVGVEEDLFPSAMANDSPREIEEERRLLYVAITRAKNQCVMSYAASRYRNGMTTTTRPSRFIADIDRKYLLLDTGDDFPSGSKTPLRPQRPTYTPPSFTQSRQSLSDLRKPTSSPAKPASSTPSASSADGFTIHSASEVSTGDRIIHQKFGRGVIVQIDDSSMGPRIKVDFADGETRTVLLKYAKFQIVK